MQFSLIGAGTFVLPVGWTSQSHFAVLGRLKIDATAVPGNGATIRAFSIIGGADIRVASGTRVRLRGGSLIGAREMDATVGDGPEITVLACTLLGGVRVAHRA